MSESTAIINTRRFIVKGKLECTFTPDSTEFIEGISNLEIELWQKSPLDIFLLGKGITDPFGNFVITFDLNDETSYLKEGIIDNVFAKVYYKDVIISGENPYIDDATPSNRPIRNITLREGLTDIGTHEIEITRFEYSVDPLYVEIAEKPIDAINNILFDIRETSTGKPLPVKSSCKFRAYINETPEYTLFTTISETVKEGYAELIVPELPVSVKQPDDDFVINLRMGGIPEIPSQECFLRLTTDSPDYYYTPITNFVVHDGKLSVYSAGLNYPIDGIPDALENVTQIGISETGVVLMYDTLLETWLTPAPLTFYQFESPENLDQISDGIYASNIDTGTITAGQLGLGTFEPFSLYLINKGVFPINIELEVHAPEGREIFTGSFLNLLPGSRNFVIVGTDEIPVLIDESPSIEDIETITGITFSVDFMDFLESKELLSINKLRKAGPIKYIDGFSDEFINESDCLVLQGHVDLYTINENAIDNQHLIDAGYDNLYKIAETPKNVFITTVESLDFTLHHAAQMHETVVQNQKLLSNLLSAKMGDYELVTPFIPDLPDSTFADTAFSKFINRCDCEDCTSAVSPFSYLVDLLKYGAKHMKKTGVPSYNPVNYNAFITLMENFLFQPFGSLSIDCDTLHKEYCRMRLVTEILEKLVATKTLPTEVAERLENDRRSFLLLTYKTMLTQAGTSYEELRSVISIQDPEEKETAALRLSNKLGIPLYIQSPYMLAVERMWLTSDNPNPGHELTATNLESIYGFRNTQQDVLIPTSGSLMSKWKEIYLMELWKKTDYLFSAYSREGVNPDDDSTFKPEWKPIIDPDSFGRSDMTYESSAFALSLWRHRKANTDEFLSDYISSNSIFSRTSVDMQRRILRIPGKNLSSVQFENDEVRIQDPSTSDFVSFKVYNTALNGTNTDIVLKQSTLDVPQETLFQPEGDEPVMRYYSILNVTTLEEDGTSIKLTWNDPVILYYMVGGDLKLTSSASEDIYSTSSSDPAFSITDIVMDPNNKIVEFTIGSALSNDFITGNISFIYEVEVALDTTITPDPELLCFELFISNQSYDYLLPEPPGMGSYFTYTVWDEPAGWPVPLNEEPTYYTKLKKLYEIIRSGTTDSSFLDIVTNNLHTDMYGFNLMMEIILSCEQYLNSMYSYDKPDTTKLYEMASVFRNSARQKLNEIWVKEEIKHIPDGETDPEELMLAANYFWKALNEPQTGPWDGSLQTIPDNVEGITPANIPIIDPELVPRQRLLISPDAETYRVVYDDRQEQLDNQRNAYFDLLVPFHVEGFKKILNHINTGYTTVNYDLGPDYGNNLNALIEDFESVDAFLQLKATTALEEAFALTADEFSVILPVMNAYQDVDPSKQPSNAELRSVTNLFVSACKRKQFYFSGVLGTGWIEEELDGSITPDEGPLKYYNVLEMKLDPVRGSLLNRSEWQQTLAEWNRVPTIFPDIVPPENIKYFEQGEKVHDLWISRNDMLHSVYDSTNFLFNSSIPTLQLFENYKIIISMVIARAQEIPVYEYYYRYFTALFEKEDAGEDIRPYLNQLNIYVSEYQVMRRVYEVLENNSAPLLPSEYEDIINIFIRINFATTGGYFSYVKEEYNENILLTGNDFQNYTPAIINFPLNMVEETTQWRSPNADKKAWKDTLNSRIDRKQSVLDEWETVIEETEDITMSVMRDALIQSLREECESLESAAERLGRTLFIETRDNCCVKHSRVSQAIETLQGLLFSLNNGVYDESIDDHGITLIAPNFNKEWEWLGSYATWRSAVFTYIYPENLLYPTLKRRQSPAFIELAETIRNANRFTPLNACQAAKNYQNYLEDIQNLKLVCTANAEAYVFRKDPLDCCGDLNNNMRKYITYYIAQSTVSGKGYYSDKPYYASSADEHDFWKVIPTLREDAKIIGCLPLNREYNSNDNPTDAALWLFFTYKEDNELKLGYLKKDLMVASSEWTEEEEVELPDLTDLFYRAAGSSYNIFNSDPSQIDSVIKPSDTLTNITICQNSTEWDFVFFVFSYNRIDGTKRHINIRYMAQDDVFDKSIASMLIFENNSLPITAIKHLSIYELDNSHKQTSITVVFENEIQTGIYGTLLMNHSSIIPTRLSFPNLIGAFKKNESDERFTIANRDSSGQTKYTEAYFTFSISLDVTLNADLHALTVGEFDKNILSIAPRYSRSNWESGNAVTVYKPNTLAGVSFVYATNALASSAIFSLAPEKNTETVPVISGECIDNFDLRAANIKKQLIDNLNAPVGNPIGSLYRTTTIKDVLYEAYYFVPMLIALDQQQRGDFPTALDWYRSVYDYTNNLSTKRKIFYGLVSEQSITNVFDRPADWLLDPLNPHLIAQTRTNAYTKYTLMNIIQCMLSYGDREFTIDTIETVPNARKLYSEALNLLKVSELHVKPSICYVKAHNCLQTAITTPIDMYWNNSFEEVQGKVERLNNIALIDEASLELADIFNSEDSMEEKFTSAFTYLASLDPGEEEHDTVIGFIDGGAERMNDAYRYLFAGIDTQPFNTTVKAHFTNTLATLTSLTPEAVSLPENEEKISWLRETTPSNAQPTEFRFINEEGMQLLNKDVAYDPINPTPVAFQSNLVFSNASIFYSPTLYEEDFTPFVDYGFCLPSNPVYSGLELKANLELFKIHNCRNIAGMERSLDIFAAPTDSTTGVPVIGAGGNLILPGTGAIIPSQYRFRVLIERAKLLVSQAQQLESQFLATLEKEDTENYNQLRARQDLQTAKSTVKLQDMRIKQALNEETVADLQLDKMQFVQDTYNDWINTGLNGYEIAAIALLTASAAGQVVAAGQAYTSAGAITDSGSGGTSLLASSLSTISSIMSQLASYQRREQEWQYQSDLAGYDIGIANQQIKIAEQNTRIVSQEREIASLNMDHATDTLEFLKTKFTNAELYRWMGNVLERTYSYMLSLATSVAKTAEQQYYFEQQQQAGPFILDDYWEVSQTGTLIGGGVDRRGLTGSTRLLQDITKLDQYAFENTKRKLQLTKVISLGQLYPDAFQTFRQTGVLNFDLTNRLFNYDFPGHYLRLINGVKVSVIGLIPVYDNIKATLTAGTTSYTVINANNTFQQVPIRRMEVDQIALTGASRATGVFEFQAAQGELLNPFEGMGVESRWEFKMPRFSNRMDYSNIADVLIEVDYTALDNFQYRYMVLQEIDNTLGFSRGFSFKNDYPDQWYELAEVQEGGTEFSVEIELKRDQFPQGIDNVRLDGSNLLLHFVRKDGFTSEVNIADFSLVNTVANSQPMIGTTVDGTFNATALTNVLSTQNPPSPFVKLRLSFANTALNRELFSREQVTDILLLVSCKADLPVYPL